MRSLLRGRLVNIITLVGFGLSLGALSTPAVAQTNGGPSLFAPGDQLEIVRRFNYTLRRNGRYQGHVEREIRTWLTLDDQHTYKGERMVSQNMIHDFRTVAAQIESREHVELTYDGTRLVQAAGVPVWQGHPTLPGADPTGDNGPATDNALPASTAHMPDHWEAPAVVPTQLPDGSIAAVPVVVAYRYDGTETYQGQQVARIAFGYSITWPMSPMQLEEHPAAELLRLSEAGASSSSDARPGGSPGADGGATAGFASLPDRRITIRANHQGVLLMPVSRGVPALHRTNIQEQMIGTDGTRDERQGFILTWYRSTPPTTDLVARIQEQAIPEVEVDRDELDRVRLSIRNLQFVADQAVLLPGERGRLDNIAELLQSVPDTEILVTGHTADVGTQESQVRLSIERAKRIVDELVDRGVRPGRLRYEGRGGTEPVGDNSTQEGRAANRRVELRLLSE